MSLWRETWLGLVRALVGREWRAGHRAGGWAARGLIQGGRGTSARKRPHWPQLRWGWPSPSPVYLLLNSACHCSDVAASVGRVTTPDPRQLLTVEVLLHRCLWGAVTPLSALHARSSGLLGLCVPWPCLRVPRPCSPFLLMSPSQSPSGFSCHLRALVGALGPLAPGCWPLLYSPLGEDSSLTSSRSPTRWAHLLPVSQSPPY